MSSLAYYLTVLSFHTEYHHLSILAGTNYPSRLGRTIGIEQDLIIGGQLLPCAIEGVGHDGTGDDEEIIILLLHAHNGIIVIPLRSQAVEGRSLHIRHPQKGLSIAENFLFMLKGRDYTELDARTMDLMLILHSEHGGGNNSTFTVRVTSSTGTDTYSSIAAGIGSLKGPKHGGANLKVMEMINYLKTNVHDWHDEEEIARHLEGILNRNEMDRHGLIYGIGHAVYTLSDPRAVLLKKLAGQLAAEKGRLPEYEFLQRIEKVAIQTIYKVKGRGKTLCANVDFYSGFVYDLIGIPQDIYTSLFAMSRIVGSVTHRVRDI